VASYPEETREVLDALYALWFDHLWDNIPTVREDSAVALAAAVKVYGREALDKVIAVVRWVAASSGSASSTSSTTVC
jgi:hypothetical protein